MSHGNRESIKKYNARYYELNKDRIMQKRKERAEQNRVYYKAWVARRKQTETTSYESISI